MITNRPCCDNCPHYNMNGMAGDYMPVNGLGACYVDSPFGRYCPKTHRCSRHPFIQHIARELSVQDDPGNLCHRLNSDDWKSYLGRVAKVHVFIRGEAK